MKDFINKKAFKILFIIILISIIIASVLSYFNLMDDIEEAIAAASDNSSGFAFSSTLGWLSFNCINDTPACSSTNYGVSVDPSTGDFSGYAWSSNAGWIDFAPTSGYPESPAHSAKYDRTDNSVTGWAKALSLGDDGWIKMSGSWTNGVSINPATGDFSGYAWNASTDSTGMGWISFNCANTGTCATSNYKVNAEINRPPIISSFSAPNWNYDQACSLQAKRAILRWVFDDPDLGSSQSAYQIILNDTNSMSSPIVDSGKLTGPATQYIITQADLDYNKAYYFWVKVWDEYDVDSGFVQYDVASDTHNDDGNNLTFTTYKHEFPDVDYSWSPSEPSKDEEVLFTDLSKIYSSASPTTAVNCDSSNCDWFWTAADSSINDSATSTPIIIFNSSGSKSVNLRVTDNDGYYCSKQSTVFTKVSLPEWEEVKPE
jgi:hypothetical protein